MNAGVRRDHEQGWLSSLTGLDWFPEAEGQVEKPSMYFVIL